MTRDTSNKKSRSSAKSPGKRSDKPKSGWSKPDGTPLRKRKGEYFPDKEIDKRKPRSKDRPFRPTADKRNEPSEGRNDKSFRNNRPDRADHSINRLKPKRSYSSDENQQGDRTTSSDDSKSRFSNEKKPYRSNSSYDRKKPFEKKREKYAKKDHSKEMKGRFDRAERNDHREKKKYAGPHRERKTNTSTEPGSKDAIRLNRYIANAGICSRREADDLITAGLVAINGKVITELGTKVLPGDEVKFHDTVLKTEKHVYVLLNKPKDFITTTDDPGDRKTVMNLIGDACKERIVPVGRLDRNTTGLLLITNDGELTKRLTHPSGNIKKIYQVELDKNLTQADMLKAAAGVELEDGVCGFDEIHYSESKEKNIIGVELHSGKNRIVRRIFEELGYKVQKLDRTTFAGLTKKDLPRGRWRFLTEMEVNMLKMLTGKKSKTN